MRVPGNSIDIMLLQQYNVLQWLFGRNNGKKRKEISGSAVIDFHNYILTIG